MYFTICARGLFCALVLAVLPTTSAAVFERDWLAPGDGLLTFDDVNNREWLDVPETLLANFGGFDFVKAETGPGGMFEGFTVAREIDVIALSESAGIDTSTFDLTINEIPARQLSGLLSPTTPSSLITLGLLDTINTDCNCPVMASIGGGRTRAGTSFSDITDLSSLDRPFNFVGVMLFRPVPEPSTFFMTLCGFASLLVVVRLRSQLSMTVF